MKKEIEDKLAHLWGKVGFIVQLSQMIEYTLSNVLAFDEILREFDNRDSMCVLEYNEFAKRANDLYEKLSKKPLGAGIKKAEKFFNTESLDRLKAVCEGRNFVIHGLFKNDLFEKHLETDPEFYYECLGNLIDEMCVINTELNDIFASQKAEYNLIW